MSKVIRVVFYPVLHRYRCFTDEGVTLFDAQDLESIKTYFDVEVSMVEMPIRFENEEKKLAYLDQVLIFTKTGIKGDLLK